MKLERVEAKSLQTRVYHSLKTALMGGHFEPGQILVIRELAQQLGVSPMPIRQALHRLVAEHGLEEQDRVRSSVRVPWLSNAVFEELRAARCVIEGEAASLAALRATKPQVAKLGKLNNALLAAVAAKNVDAAILANYEFHFALYRIAQSTTLLRIIESLWLQSGPYFRILIMRSFETMTDPFQNLNTNDRLLTAIAANDAQGARVALEDDINVAAQLYREMAAQRAEPATVEAVG